MAFSLLADVEVRAITDLGPQWFQERGIRLLLLDFDNTVVAYTTTEPTEEFLAWLGQMREANISVMVVSNSRKSRRVPEFCQRFGIPWIKRLGSPIPRGFVGPWNSRAFLQQKRPWLEIRPLRIFWEEIWRELPRCWFTQFTSPIPSR